MKYQLTKPCLDNSEVEAVKRIMESGWLAEGKETRQFEKNLAEFVGAKFAVAVSNCTVALELSLRASHILEQAIIIPSFTHPATIRAVLNAHCIPLLRDVSLETYNIEHEGYVSTIPVSWGGNPVYHANNIVVEDAACSLGAVKQGNYPLCFSFHPRKLITTGEGGAITTNDEKLADNIRELKNFGYSNCKFDDVRAAIGNSQLRKLPKIIEERIRKAQIYDKLLEDVKNVKVPYKHELALHTYQTYAIYIIKGNRDKIIHNLRQHGIECQFGAYALHRLPAFKNFGRIGQLRNSELLSQRLLALPMAYDLSEEDQNFIVEALKRELS